ENGLSGSGASARASRTARDRITKYRGRAASREDLPMRVIRHLAAGAALAALCTLGTAYPAAAQNNPSAAKTQRQLDIAAARADRKAIVGANMKLTDEQSKAFWPLYDAYEAKMDKLDDRHAAEVKTYAQHYQTLTDADATNKLNEVIA